MTTSGTITYAPTARDIISFALNKLKVIKPDDDPSPAHLSRGVRELNLLLKGWMKYNTMWRLTEGSVALSNATSAYVLSPLPHMVHQVRYRSAATVDTELTWMPRGEYYALPNKSTAGVPAQYHIDYQRATVTINVYPVQTVVTTACTG